MSRAGWCGILASMITTIRKTVDIPADKRRTAEEAVAYCRGLAKRMGSRLTSELSLAWRREDRELEERQYRKRHGDRV